MTNRHLTFTLFVCSV